LNEGASIVLISHLGRPEGQINPAMSLMPVGETLAGLLEMPIKFSDNCVSSDAKDVSLGLKPGEVHLLENLRFHDDETKNDKHFSYLLSKHGGIYINDAFGTAHRAHASNVGVVKNFSQKGMGFLIEKELKFLHSVNRNPKRPLTLILGGAKIGGKLELIHQFIQNADSIIIGGGMAFTFLKAKGHDVGVSLVDDTMIDIANSILKEARIKKTDIIFPSDFIGVEKPEKPGSIKIMKIDHIPSTKMGVDVGPASAQQFSEIIQSSGTIIWNGPMGIFEVPEYSIGTRGIAQAMVKATNEGAITVVGGGDTASAVKQFGVHNDMSHVSTGGGASLELLSGNQLPALFALEQ
jgi:3-phosphoglycerate kinase